MRPALRLDGYTAIAMLDCIDFVDRSGQVITQAERKRALVAAEDLSAGDTFVNYPWERMLLRTALVYEVM